MSPDVSLTDSLWPGYALLAAITVTAVLALLALTLVPRPAPTRTLRDKVKDSDVRDRAADGESALEWLPPEAVDGDRRRGVRRGGPVTPIRVSDRPDGADAEGLVLDRSSGGLRFAYESPVPEGEVVFVRAAEGPWVEAVVRHCRPHADYFVVGCEFLHPQPWAVLLLFG